MLSCRLTKRTLLSAVLLGSVTFLPTFTLSAQPVAHEHDHDHDHIHSSVATESLYNSYNHWVEAGNSSQKSVALEQMLSEAQERHQLMSELIQSHPSEAIRMAIPDEKQKGMPESVKAYLEQRFAAEGELVVQYIDYEDGSHQLQHILKTKAGNRYQLHLDHPVKGLKTGDSVQVDGLLLSNLDNGQSSGDIALDDSDILRLAIDGSGSGSEPGPVANTLGEQRTLVMLVNFLDDQSQPWSKADVQNLLHGEVNDFMQENSYGQTWINADVAGWFTIGYNKADGCSEMWYADAADAAATQAGYDLTNYDRLIYAFPLNSNCGYGGIGTVGGAPSQSWVNGKLSFKTYTHELGHNFGLGHSHDLDCGADSVGSNCSVTEYGDYPDIMGSGHLGHFNAFQKDRLGWLGHGNSPELTTITSDGTYTINPLELQDGSVKGLKVLKSTDPQTGEKTWYYMEYRQAIGFDSGLTMNWKQNFTSGVTIHSGNKSRHYTSYLLDMNPGDGDFIDAALEAGQTFEDPEAGVSITTTAAGGSAQVVVSLSGGTEPSCTFAAPSLSAASTSSPWVEAGTAVSYNLTLTNNDSAACDSRSFTMAAAQPAGWSSQFSQNSISLEPGSSVAVTLTVTSASSAVNGYYDITASATADSDYASQALTYVVDNPAVNTAPVAANDSAVTDENTSVTINVLTNDSDSDGDSLTVTSLSGVYGSAVINGNNTITFTPVNGFSGTESFNYSISDGNGGSDSASVNVTVNNVNQAPVAQNDSAVTDMDLAVTISVLSNDSDPDGDSLSVISASSTNGSVTINGNGTITYSPANGFYGVDTITYTISDGNGGSSSAIVSVTVNQVQSNSAPVAVNDQVVISSKTAITFQVLGNDWDPESDALEVVSVTQGSKGSVQINSDGSLTYVPGRRFKTNDSFSYTISDGQLTASASVTIQLQSDSGSDDGGNSNKGKGKK